MNKQITSLEFCLENCEGILVGKDSIKHFFNENNEISLLLEDHGDCSYTTTWSEYNMTHPLKRLIDYQDIVSIIITYDDNSIEEMAPEWYSESEYYTPQNNKYQANKIIDYKTVSIAISKRLYINNRVEELNNTISQAKEELKSLGYELVSDIINKDFVTKNSTNEYDNIK